MNASGTLYNQTAPVSALVNAGWTKVDGYNAYQLVSVDGLYQFFDTYAAQDSWLAADNARFTASKSQLIEATTGESYLLGHWTDGALMRAALAAYAQKAATNNGDFFDVPTSHWAYDTVKWAVDRGITNGTSATSFSPNSTCTKAQILTFLWRAKGEPAAGNTNPFQDVPLSAYYYQPALWARNQGLVNGTLFQPNSPCTRAQTVYYLWQLAGSPNVSGTTNFQDSSRQRDLCQGRSVGGAAEDHGRHLLHDLLPSGHLHQSPDRDLPLPCAEVIFAGPSLRGRPSFAFPAEKPCKILEFPV